MLSRVSVCRSVVWDEWPRSDVRGTWQGSWCTVN